MVETEQREVVGAVSVAPNGLPIYFQHDPRRYRLGPLAPDQAGTSWELETEPEWDIVPSVSEVLDVLHKPGLPWWGMTTGVEGLMALNGLGLVRETAYNGHPALAVPDGPDRTNWSPATAEELTSLLTAQQLTVNHVRDKAGTRGLAVHGALEDWADSGRLPDPTIFPAEEEGYVRGLLAFLRDVDPEPVASEVMVASREFGFAGRYDLRLRVTKPRPVVAKIYPKKPPLMKTLQPGELLTDLKSSKGVYESHPRQLEAYEKGSIECGWPPTLARGIIHVTEDGRYEFVRSWAEFSDFLAVLMVWRSDQAMKRRKKELTK